MRFIEDTPIENFTTIKKENFQIRNSDIFHITAQSIDCGYSLEPPRRGGSHEYQQPMFFSKIRKIMYTPVNQFYYTRVLQKVLSLGSDYFSVTFCQTYFYYKPSKSSLLLKHIFVTLLPSREKQINSLLLVSVGDTDK